MRYPFTPEHLDALPEELAEIYRQLEIDILIAITDRLTAADKLNEVTVQNIRALRSHGLEMDEIVRVIRKTAGISQKKMDSLLDDVVARNQQYYSQLITIADVTAPETLVDAAVIDGIKRQTLGELANLTRSMGFMVGGTKIPPAEAYQWALDNAALQVQSGAFSYGDAIARATRQLADSGLYAVEYESGHRNRVDVAVRRAVMTGVSQINRRFDEQSMELLETDLVEVSAHAGARDKGDGFENHKSWQGKVYRWRRYTQMFPNASSGNYPDFETECGYGDVQGILGANCRHRWSPFVEGVSERTYTDDQLANIDKPPFTYQGKQYTTYEATQKQRQIETAVRHWKRREAAATNSEDKTAAQIRIRRLNEEYEQFSNAAGLRMQKERMAVYVQKDMEPPAVNTPSPVPPAQPPAPVEAKTFAEKIADIRAKKDELLADGVLPRSDEAEAKYDGYVYEAGDLFATEYKAHAKEIEGKIAPLQDRLAEIKAATAAEYDKDPRQYDFEKLDAWADEERRLVIQIRDIKSKPEKWLRDELDAIRGVGYGGEIDKAHFSHGKSPKIKVVSEAYDLYPTEWVKTSVAHNRLEVGSVDRGYYFKGYGNGYPSEIKISGGGRESLETAIHELGHRFEHVVPDIVGAERRFYDKRCGGEELVWLGPGYKKSEMARHDKFLDHYMGKDYGGNAFELVSMGFEYAFTRPERLADDPDMQKWIYGLLAIG